LLCVLEHASMSPSLNKPPRVASSSSFTSSRLSFQSVRSRVTAGSYAPDVHNLYITCSTFFTRDSIYAIARICHASFVCLSVHLSVTRVLCVKTAERIIEILSLSCRPIILVLRHRGSLACVNLTASPPTRAPNTRGGNDFRPICSTSRKR